MKKILHTIAIIMSTAVGVHASGFNFFASSVAVSDPLTITQPVGIAGFQNFTTTGNIGLVAAGYSAVLSGNVYQGFTSGGTMAVPTPTPSGYTLSSLGGYGYDGVAWSPQSKGSVRVRASELWTPSANGTEAAFLLTPNGALSSTEKMRLTGDGRLGVGVTAPITKLDVSGGAHFSSSATADAGFYGTLADINGTASFGATPTSQTNIYGSSISIVSETIDQNFVPVMEFYKYSYQAKPMMINFYTSSGTQSTPLAVGNNAGLWRINTYAHDGVAFSGTENANIGVRAEEAFTPTAHGTRFEVALTPAGTTTSAVKMTVKGNGRLGLGNANPAYLLDVTGGGHFTSSMTVDGGYYGSGSNLTGVVTTETDPVSLHLTGGRVTGTLTTDFTSVAGPSLSFSNPSDGTYGPMGFSRVSDGVTQFAFYGVSNAPAMTISHLAGGADNQMRVGIGNITSPAETLDVGGNIKSNGNIVLSGLSKGITWSNATVQTDSTGAVVKTTTGGQDRIVVDGTGNVTVSGPITAQSPFYAPVRTLAAMNALAPVQAGGLISVSNAAAPYTYCVSTGTAAGSWVVMGQTIHCQ